MALILGVANGNHDCSACLFDDYNLLAAVPLERITRVKTDGGRFPDEAVNEVCAIVGVSRYEIDVIAMLEGAAPPRWFSTPYALGLRGARQRFRDTRSAGVHGPQTSIFAARRRQGLDDPLLVFDAERFLAQSGFHPKAEVSFQPHHFSHAIQPLFHRSEWDNALLYSVDGGGDRLMASAHHFTGDAIDTIFGMFADLSDRRPTIVSPATIYGLCTEFVGYKSNRHEGKLTGLAARGEPNAYDALRSAFWVAPDGQILSELRGSKQAGHWLAGVLEGLSKEDVATSVQRFAEDITIDAVRTMLANTGAKQLGVSGGLFANVLLNQKLLDQTDAEEIFIYPSMSDQGLSTGVAMAHLLKRDGLPAWLERRASIPSLYLGRDFSAVVDQVFERAGLTRLDGDPVACAVQAIELGDAVAIYAERMEFGPRALGARSVMADPRSTTINDSLNKRMERSEFMPFAPYVAEEDADAVFDLPVGAKEAARFMTITCAVRPEWRDRLPAVTHVDGTARPQLVRRDENPLYYDIVKAFGAKTGVPVLINTSFNVHEEPIINTPAECVRALIDDRVDAVVTRSGLWVAPDKTSKTS